MLTLLAIAGLIYLLRVALALREWQRIDCEQDHFWRTNDD